MGYFSSVLAEPAAQAAGRLTLRQIVQAGKVSDQIYDPLFQSLGNTDWQTAGGVTESGAAYDLNIPNDAAYKQLEGYTFDWKDTGHGDTGTLTVYDPVGKQIGSYQQRDGSDWDDFKDYVALAAVGFGGLGLAGFGPAAGLFGGAGAGASGGFTAGAIDSAALGLDTAAGAAATGGEITGGLTLGGSAGYGTIAGAPGVAGAAAGTYAPVLGAGGAALSTGAGITAPAFTGGGAGIVGGLGMTAGAGAGTAAAGAGGITSLLSGLGSASGIRDLASIASGIYGMSLVGKARDAADPFAQYRPAYGAQLAALEANPGSIVSRPGFQAGLETIQRKSAASGYYGSGNMASALGRYSGDFYNQEATRLAGLAGAGQTPGAGQFPAADLASRSLGSIGYGLAPMLERFIRGG